MSCVIFNYINAIVNFEKRLCKKMIILYLIVMKGRTWG